jgi:hypothetical protein
LRLAYLSNLDCKLVDRKAPYPARPDSGDPATEMA